MVLTIRIFIGVAAVLVFALVFRWYWKTWWKKFWKLHHDKMGLADVEQLAHWNAEDFDREFKYFRQRFERTTDENQKHERSLDILALIDVARHHGFAQVRDGEDFETLHFVKIGKK